MVAGQSAWQRQSGGRLLVFHEMVVFKAPAGSWPPGPGCHRLAVADRDRLCRWLAAGGMG
jgi:hypothetical protein